MSRLRKTGYCCIIDPIARVRDVMTPAVEFLCGYEWHQHEAPIAVGAWFISANSTPWCILNGVRSSSQRAGNTLRRASLYQLSPVHTGDYSRRFRRQSPFSATVAEFGDVSGDYSRRIVASWIVASVDRALLSAFSLSRTTLGKLFTHVIAVTWVNNLPRVVRCHQQYIMVLIKLRWRSARRVRTNF